MNRVKSNLKLLKYLSINIINGNNLIDLIQLIEISRLSFDDSMISIDIWNLR